MYIRCLWGGFIVLILVFFKFINSLFIFVFLGLPGKIILRKQ